MGTVWPQRKTIINCSALVSQRNADLELCRTAFRNYKQNTRLMSNIQEITTHDKSGFHLEIQNKEERVMCDSVQANTQK